ncbi:hypothetical protein [Mycoplasma sp. E35C]|uniref:hypothetical protein n=1 Tax=Mycoplasma sp. E35C TaxID=2801918 RepID=UPI001CA38ED4|nr:hypothetical protein [Mycoplasma sp. E35C]QZX48861.1 hypothetical protein JJE79_02255 [Mycoplasma sp. E35C]
MDNKDNKRNQFYFNKRQSANKLKTNKFNDFDSDLIKELNLDNDNQNRYTNNNKNKQSTKDDLAFLDDVISDYENWSKNRTVTKQKSILNDINDQEDDLDLDFEIHRSSFINDNETKNKANLKVDDEIKKTRFVGDDPTEDSDNNLIEAFTKNLSSYISTQDDTNEPIKINQDNNKKIDKDDIKVDDINPIKQSISSVFEEDSTHKFINEKTDIITKTKDEEHLTNGSNYDFEQTDDHEEQQVDLTNILDVQYEPNDDTNNLISTNEVLNSMPDHTKDYLKTNLDDREIKTDKTQPIKQPTAQKNTAFDDFLIEDITKEEIENATKVVDFDQVESKQPELSNQEIDINKVTKSALKDVEEHYLKNIAKLEEYKEHLEKRSKDLDELNDSLNKRQIDIELISDDMKKEIQNHRSQMELARLNLEKEREQILKQASEQAQEIISNAYKQVNEYKQILEQNQNVQNQEQSLVEINQLKTGIETKFNQLSTQINHDLEVRLIKKDELVTQLLAQLKVMAETTHSNQLRINELFLDVNAKDKEIQTLKRDIAILKSSTNQVINIQNQPTRELAKKHFEDFELGANSFNDLALETKLQSLTSELTSLSNEVVYEAVNEKKDELTKKTLRSFNVNDLNESLKEDKKIFESINNHFEKNINQIRAKNQQNNHKTKIYNPNFINKYKTEINEEIEEWSLNDIDNTLTDEYNSLLMKTKKIELKDQKNNNKQSTKRVQLVFDKKN